MQPFELTIEGFRSHRERHTFEFEGRTLFGIVGPIGAGKSSILDALIYALFGKTPWIGKSTTKLINSSCDDARIRLVFEADDREWEVTRVLRRKGASQVTLRRRDGDEVVESGERNVNARVEQILGLDFDAFRSSVTLPQGQFQRFLHAEPKERSSVLKGVFRLERVDAIREAAKAGAAEMSGALREKEALIEALTAKADGLDAARSAYEGEEKRVSELSSAVEEASRAEAALVKGASEIELHEREIGRFEEALRGVPSTEDISEIVDREAKQAEVLTAATKAHREADAARTKALDSARKATEEWGGEGLEDAKRLLAQRKALTEKIGAGRTEAERLAEEVASIGKEAEGAKSEAGKAAAALEAATADLEAAHRRHAAHLVRQDLVKGEACPVCEQEVQVLPGRSRPPTLKKAEDARKRVAALATKADRAHSALEKRLDTAVALSQNFKQTLDSAIEEEGSLAERLKGILGDVDPENEITRREAVLSAAQQEALEAESALRVGSKELEEAREAFEQVATRRRTLAGSLIGICTLLGVDPPSIEDEAPDLAAAAKGAVETGEIKVRRLKGSIEEIETSAKGYRSVLEGFRDRFELRDEEAPHEALARAHERLGAMRTGLEEAEAAAARSASLAEEIAQVRGRRELFARLAADLTDSKFIRFLLDEQRRLLSRLGSEQLMELSGGRYRFTDDGEFHIHDLAQDAVRTADTLSGGETFLASLALALALAEAVAQGGSRLGCFFLDEGFGSLDPESLSLALEGIERLASPGRLIGLISHVRDLQTQLDDLIILERGEDGSTMVVQTEGPISYALPPI